MHELSDFLNNMMNDKSMSEMSRKCADVLKKALLNSRLYEICHMNKSITYYADFDRTQNRECMFVVYNQNILECHFQVMRFCLSDNNICLYRKIGESEIEGFKNIDFNEFLDRLQDKSSKLNEMLSFL